MSNLDSAQNQTSKTPRLKVAICGGGVAGLVLAVALSKHDDIEVKMYEAAECFKEIGAGVTIWGRAFNILARMGLDNDMRLAEDVPTDGMHDPTFGFDMRKSDQPEEGFVWKALRLPYTCIYFHRARFLDVLVKHYPTGVAHFRKRLATYSQLDSGAVTLRFADGTSTTCDVLLGCDGIHSAVRREMYKKEAALRGQPDLLRHIEPVFSGSIVYRTLIPTELLTGEDGPKHPAMCAPMMYCGRAKHIVTYPVAGGSVCNFAAITTDRDAIGRQYDGPWMSECSAQEVLDCYADWEPQARDLINHIHPRTPMKWAIHEVFPVPFSAAGNVALVGDAAHAMTPFQGAGAGQAIEDAYVLAGLLAHPSTTRQTVSRALKAYEHVRLPLAKHVQESSRKYGHMSQLDAEYGDDYEKLSQAMEIRWDWVYGPDPHSDLERAVRWCYPTESVRAQL